MRIEFKLFATLSEYLPAGAQGHSVVVDIPDGTTIHAVIDRFHVPREKAYLVVCNGVYVHFSERDTFELQEGDALALWPPIAGG
jgi:molybdopterin converting factor small subunit